MVIKTREMDDNGEQQSISVRFFSADGSTICDMSYILLPTHDYHDTYCTRRPEPDRRGRLRAYRAFVPVAYPVPEDCALHISPSPFHVLLGLMPCVGVLL